MCFLYRKVKDEIEKTLDHKELHWQDLSLVEKIRLNHKDTSCNVK